MAFGGVEGRRLDGPSPASRGPEGGEWGGRIAPWFLASLLWFPGPDSSRLRGGGL